MFQFMPDRISNTLNFNSAFIMGHTIYKVNSILIILEVITNSNRINC